MDAKQIEDMAEKAQRDGDVNAAIVLYALAAAKRSGADREFAALVAEICRGAVAGLKYAKWVQEG